MSLWIEALGTSLARISLGFALAAVVGLALGLLTGRVAWLGDALGPFMTAFQALPSICWFPLVFLWLGWTETAILFVTVTGALFAVASAVSAGVKSIPPLYLNAAANMGARGLLLYTRVIFPAALPSVLGGLRQGWAFAWRSLIAGELLSGSKGLGYLLTEGRELNDLAHVSAAVMLILLVGLLVDGVFLTRIEGGVRRRWGLAPTS